MKTIKRALSKDALRGYSLNSETATVVPNFNLNSCVIAIDNDPVARGALQHFVDKAMEGDYAIVDKNTFAYDPIEELTLDEKFQFRNEVLRKTFLMLKLFNNAYIEIVKTPISNVTKAVNVLDSQNIEVITAPNGDPLSYKSLTVDPNTGDYPEWTPQEIVWIKLNDRSVGWAPIDFKALWTILYIKESIKKYVAWLWATGQYRLIYNFKNASEKDIQDTLVYMRKNDENFRAPFLIKGDMETKILRDMKETESLVQMLEYLDGQTLICLRIPPIDAGIPDASGRSNSDAQSNNLSTHITSVKKIVEDKISFELFPKINKGNNLLRFAPSDRFAEKQVFENIQILKSIGMTNEAIEEYLKDRGMFFKTQKVFHDVEVDNPRDKDMAPSRVGKGTQEANSQGNDTTRDDQLRKS